MKTKDVNGVRLYPTEEQEQTVVMHWAAMMEGRWPELRLLFHIPNGGKRTKTEAARFRAAGVRSGVPDLFLPCACGGYHGLWIEMKAVGGRVSAEQARWLRELQAAGYLCRVCYGADAAIKELERYMQMREEARHGGGNDGGRNDAVSVATAGDRARPGAARAVSAGEVCPEDRGGNRAEDPARRG